jgi:hypothetical protein
MFNAGTDHHVWNDALITEKVDPNRYAAELIGRRVSLPYVS